MPERGGQERTEKATVKRRQEARRKGQVAQSREIPSVLILLTALAVFYFAGSWMCWNIADVIGGVFERLDTLRLEAVSDVSAFSAEIFKKAFVTRKHIDIVVVAELIDRFNFDVGIVSEFLLNFVV